MMLDPEQIALILKAGDVYVIGAAFVYWAWKADRRFVAIETTLHMMLQRQQKG